MWIHCLPLSLCIQSLSLLHSSPSGKEIKMNSERTQFLMKSLKLKKATIELEVKVDHFLLRGKELSIQLFLPTS